MKKEIEFEEVKTEEQEIKKPEESNQIDFEKVQEHPEKYIEINMIKKTRVVETFYIYAENDTFTYGKKGKEKNYNINEKAIYQFPKKKTLIPVAFYKEGKENPIMFKDENKGITCRALTLLYDLKLYRVWMKPELKNYNIILIIMIMISIIFNAVQFYASSFGGVTW